MSLFGFRLGGTFVIVIKKSREKKQKEHGRKAKVGKTNAKAQV